METLNRKPLDPDQKTAVELRKNGTVSAGAGAGKTTVLAARYVDLLSSGEVGVEDILVLTFTRKAAAEMYSRIRSAVSSSPDEKVRAHKASFRSASIMTLDAFCGRIVRDVAYRKGFPRDFKADPTAPLELAEELALDYLLSNSGDPVLGELAARQDFVTTWKSLFANAVPKLAGPGSSDDSWFRKAGARAEKEIVRIVDEGFASLAGSASAVASLASGLEKPNEDCAAAIGFFKDAAEKLDPLPEDFPGRARLCQTIGAGLGALKLVQYSRKSAAQSSIKDIAFAWREKAGFFTGAGLFFSDIDLHRACLCHLDIFAEKYRKAARDRGVMGFPDVERLAVELLRSDPELRLEWKKAYRYIMIDEFQDNSERQKELLFLLAEREDLASPGIPVASDLVPDKLFFVGDEKQSIYRFRGADVSVFRRLARELDSRGGGGVDFPSGSPAPGPDSAPAEAATSAPAPAAGPALVAASSPAALSASTSASGPAPAEAATPGEDLSIRLSTNYRSEPALVDFFNQTFSRILGSGREDFEAKFTPIGSRPANPGVKPSIRYLLREQSPGSGRDPEERSEVEILARAVASFIVEHVSHKDLSVPDGSGGSRPAGFDDFAVLLRTTSNQYILERFFRLSGIPYTTTDVCGFFIESPVNDMHALLALALDPGDREAAATYLRSPFARLSDDGFTLVMAASVPPVSAPPGLAPPRDQPQVIVPGQPGHGEPSADVLASFDASLLSLPDQERLSRATGILDRVRAVADRLPLPALVSWIWFEAGLRAAILARPDAHPYLEHFEVVFDLACKAWNEGRNLASFLEKDMEPYLGDIDRISVEGLQRDYERGVRIMTVHKAKGLEFPVVILPWMNAAGAQGRGRKAWYPVADNGISLDLPRYRHGEVKTSNPFILAAKDREDEMEIAESRRLFYVGCTRAIAHLVFAGAVPQKAENKPRSFHALLAGGNGMMDASGTFLAMEDCVRIEPVKSMNNEEYLRLFQGTRTWTPEEFASAYAQASPILRTATRRWFSVTELEAGLVDLALPGVASGLVAGMTVGMTVGMHGALPGESGLDEDSILYSGFSPDAATRIGQALYGNQGKIEDFGLLSHEEMQGRAELSGDSRYRDTSPAFLQSGTEDSARMKVKDAGIFGELCHSLVQEKIARIRGEGGREAEDGVCESFLNDQGYPLASQSRKAVLKAMVVDARRLVEDFAGSPLALRVKRSDRAVTEKPFLRSLGEGRGVKGRMDLVLEDEAGVLVVDFKSSRHAIPELHEFQLWLYRQSLADLNPGREVKAALFWLRSGRLDTLEKDFDPGLPALLASRLCDRNPPDASPAADACPP